MGLTKFRIYGVVKGLGFGVCLSAALSLSACASSGMLGAGKLAAVATSSSCANPVILKHALKGESKASLSANDISEIERIARVRVMGFKTATFVSGSGCADKGITKYKLTDADDAPTTPLYVKHMTKAQIKADPNVRCGPKFKQLYQPPTKLSGAGKILSLPDGEGCEKTNRYHKIAEIGLDSTRSSYRDYNINDDIITNILIKRHPYFDSFDSMLETYVRLVNDKGAIQDGLEELLNELFEKLDTDELLFERRCRNLLPTGKFDFGCSVDLSSFSGRVVEYFLLLQNYFPSAGCPSKAYCIDEQRLGQSLDLVRSISSFASVDWINPSIIVDLSGPQVDSDESYNRWHCETLFNSSKVYLDSYRLALNLHDDGRGLKLFFERTSGLKYFSGGVLSEDTEFKTQFDKCSDWKTIDFLQLEMSNLYNSLLSQKISPSNAALEYSSIMLRLNSETARMATKNKAPNPTYDYEKITIEVISLKFLLHLYESHNYDVSLMGDTVLMAKMDEGHHWLPAPYEVIEGLELYLLTYSPILNRSLWRNTAITLYEFYGRTISPLNSRGINPINLEDFQVRQANICTLALVNGVSGVCE
ncbi:MAG: hypothetical protein JKY25_03475 [Robiginitomaculum sp.]|nr:hypothetical protein [Robiginitomaculum sp.]